ncbi:RNA polymerase recycling motor HelD [Alloiococcus sp. CFN-8]|uniref:RNA polymerase recycling motor HelD n=1 Tax=Alloiococcus sp. CFN-8 TaxID=3416081 RepID=UPI003CE8880F
MDRNYMEWKEEEDRLSAVLQEVKKQLNEKRDFKERFKKDSIATQRELWQDIGSVSVNNGLEQVVDFMQFINTMKVQKRSYEFTRKLEAKYERMLMSPYFGRIDFKEKDEKRADRYYIGISNLINDSYDFLIYDWRAPIASMFYDYEIGEASYECPEGVIDGNLILKRQYKVSDGKLEYMFDSNINIDDEVLQAILSKNTDSKMKAIVTTIQRDQNKIIRNEEYKYLIVQGPAGSGKTSVALHRIAYLLYKHREKITPENIIIFSPNNIFNDYISNVLPQLGEDNTFQTTFKEYMHMTLGVEYKKEAYSYMMEYILTAREEEGYQRRINSIKFKSSKEFLEVLKEYVTYLEKTERSFPDIFYGDNLIISAKDIEDLYFKDYGMLPLKRRLQKIRERLLYLFDPYEKRQMEEAYLKLKESEPYLDNFEIRELGKALVKEEVEKVHNEISRITVFNLIDIYKNLFIDIELFTSKINADYNRKLIDEIKSYTLEKLNDYSFNYEDQVPLLYLKGVLGDLPKTSEIKYVIIDEAQDYTPLQYEIFYQLFKEANITILGDLQQSINTFMRLGDYSNISTVFPMDNTFRINLSKSYRSTLEITRFSRRLLNEDLGEEYVTRSGDEPVVIGLPTEEDIRAALLKDIVRYKGRGYKSIGIITRTAKEASNVYGYLKEKLKVKAIIDEDDEYVSDLLVIPAYLAKGLEFDVVFIYNAGEGNYSHEEEKLLLYTACTRALHVLNIYYSGQCTPLLKESVKPISK